MKVTVIFHQKLNSACDTVWGRHHFLCWIFLVFSYFKNLNCILCLESRIWSCKSTFPGLVEVFLEKKKRMSVCFHNILLPQKTSAKCHKCNNESIISFSLLFMGTNHSSFIIHPRNDILLKFCKKCIRLRLCAAFVFNS